MVLGNVARAAGDIERARGLYARAAQVSGEIGFVWWQGSMLSAVADAELLLGRFDEAAASTREAMRIARTIGDRQGEVFALANLAAVYAGTGRPSEAGRAWGAIEAEESRARIGQWEDTREETAPLVMAAAGEAFERGRAAGRLLPLDAVVDEALAEADA
jgi:tetratricopeptide (TPR) repeat protein